PPEPDYSQIHDARAAALLDREDLLERELGIVHDQVVLQAQEVPADETEIFESYLPFCGVVLSRGIQPSTPIDQQMFVHVRRTQLVGLDRTEDGLDWHLLSSRFVRRVECFLGQLVPALSRAAAGTGVERARLLRRGGLIEL